MSGATLPKSRRAKRCRAGGAKPNAGCDTDDCHTIKGADTGFRRTACIHPRRAKRRAQVCGDSTVKSDGRWAGSPHPPQAVPLPLEGKDITWLKLRRDCKCRARQCLAGHASCAYLCIALLFSAVYKIFQTVTGKCFPQIFRIQQTASVRFCLYNKINMPDTVWHIHLAVKERPRLTAGGYSHSRAPAGRSPTPPTAMRRWGGLEGVTPPHHYRRGQRLSTDTVHSPAPREAPGSGLR